MTDDTGETVRTYDELNRVISKNVGNISGEALYKYDILVFDGNDYLTAEVSVDNEGNEITKVYDKAGRLKYVVDDELVSGSSISSADSTKLTEYDYYDNGARESIRHPQFTEGSNTYRYRQFYTYHNDGLLNRLITRKMEITGSGETDVSQLERFEYRYDNAGNQTAKIETVNGVAKGRTDFEYDDLNRLEKVTEPEGRETVYTFDAAGNRKTEAITESGATINKIYHYNDKNWLEEVEVLGAETIEYDYDEDGNQTEVRKIENGVTEVIAEYKYDPLNRLVEAVTDTGAVTYAYNGEGRRVEKSTGQGTIYYLYEYDKVVLEVDGTGDQVARNLYGINLLMRDVDEDSYYYVYNGHADVTALINASTGNVEATYYYDPFGNILESTGSVNNNITYAGYQYDEETGLYYLNARMYDPKVARFLQEDTYRGDPNDPLSLNLYSYGHNNPILYHDPTGYAVLIYHNGKYYSPQEMASGKHYTNKQKIQKAYIDVKKKISNAWNATSGWTTGTIESIPQKTRNIIYDVKETEIYSTFLDATKDEYVTVDVRSRKIDVPVDWAFYVGGFYRDENEVYHARQSWSIQSFRYSGFNEGYDYIFNATTSMNKANFPFTHDGTDYIFWAWKGDYLNLGAGAEMGIYRRMEIGGTKTEHWLVDRSLSMPMTLTLEYEGEGEPIISYNPKKDDPKSKKYNINRFLEGQNLNKWWITGFNPDYQDVQASDLTATYTVDFSDKKGMYDAFYDSLDREEREDWNFDNNTYIAKFTFK